MLNCFCFVSFDKNPVHNLRKRKRCVQIASMPKQKKKNEYVKVTLGPKVILDSYEVAEYFEKRKKKNEIVSVDDSVVGDLNESVVFISEERASAEVKKVRDLYKFIYQQKHRIRRLKLEVEVLQNIILKDNKSMNAEPTNELMLPNEVENHSNTFDLTFDDDWVEKQIIEWRENGEISQICDDFVQFINELDLG